MGDQLQTHCDHPTCVAARNVSRARLASRLSMENSVVHTECTPIDVTHTVLSFFEAPLHLDAGTRLPNPHVTSAHGRTPKQHRCFGSSSCHHTDHEGTSRTQDSLVLSHTASINNRSRLSVCLHRSPVPELQRSLLSKWSQGRLPACSCTLSLPPSPRPLYPGHLDSLSPQRTTTKCPSRGA